MDKDWSWLWYLIGALGVAFLIISIIMGFIWDEFNWYFWIAIVACILLIVFAFIMYFVYERHLKIKISNEGAIDRDVFLDDTDPESSKGPGGDDKTPISTTQQVNAYTKPV